MTPITVNHLIFDILFDYITPKVHRASASRYRSRVAIMLTHNIRRGYIRARVKEENHIEREEEEGEERANHECRSRRIARSTEDLQTMAP